MGQVSWVRQFGLAVFLVVLGGAAYWLEFKQKPEKQKAEEQAKSVFKIKDLPVQAIRLEGPGGKFEFRCLDFDKGLCKPTDQSPWEVTFPKKLRADDANVNSLLSSLSYQTLNDTVDLKEDPEDKRQAFLKEAGLDRASRQASTTRKITLQYKDGAKTLYLGESQSVGDTIYALIIEEGQPDETKVYLVSSYIKANFEKDFNHWRNKKIADIAAADVAKFMLKNKKGLLSAERVGGQWQLSDSAAGKSVPGDTEQIESLLGTLSNFSAKSFVSDQKTDESAKKALQGTQDWAELTVFKKKEDNKPAPAPVVFKLLQLPSKAASSDPKSPKSKAPAHPPAESGERVFLTASDLEPLFEIEPFTKDRFDKAAKDLRLTKLVSSSERYSAKKLEFSGKPIGGSPLALEMKEGKWVLQGGAEADHEKVQATLDKLSGNRIQEFLKTIPAGEDTGVRLTLGDEKNPALRKFSFWKSGDKVYGRDLMAKTSEAYRLDPVVKDAIPWDATYFKKAPPPAPSPAAPPVPGRK